MKIIPIVSMHQISDFNAKCTKFDWPWALSQAPRGNLKCSSDPIDDGEGDRLPLHTELTISWSSEIHSYTIPQKCTIVRSLAEFEPAGPFIFTALPYH